jgi:hypothetical protein
MSSTRSICRPSTMMIFRFWSWESFWIILSKPTSSKTLFAVSTIACSLRGASNSVVYFRRRPSMKDIVGSGFLVGRMKDPAPGIKPKARINIAHLKYQVSRVVLHEYCFPEAICTYTRSSAFLHALPNAFPAKHRPIRHPAILL